MTITLDTLPHAHAEMARATLAWSDTAWDAAQGLLVLESNDAPGRAALVRESVWYSLGLLLRDGPGDRARAAQALATALLYQYDAVGMPYHGTFARYAGELAPPGQAAVVWRDYDPNWRQFIGTTLAMILSDHAAKLPAELVARLAHAIILAVEGEPPERCPPWYANIALMKAGLLAWAGAWFGRAEWQREAETVAQAIYALFARHDSFYEYNSPTYYGVNLFALGFWRRFSMSSRLQELGATMEAALWRDVAAFYHPGLRNLCGPFMRAYGMEMMRYASLLGLCIWGVVGREAAPFPDTTQPFDHAADVVMGPCLAAVGMAPPADVVSHLTRFSGERRINRLIAAEPGRRVTAWLGAQVMAGAEEVILRGMPADDRRLAWFAELGLQYHPLTVHWLTARGGVGTLRLAVRGPVAARVDGPSLLLAALPAYRPDAWEFRVTLPTGSHPPDFAAATWRLDGLRLVLEGAPVSVTVETGAGEWRVTLPSDALWMHLIPDSTD